VLVHVVDEVCDCVIDDVEDCDCVIDDVEDCDCEIVDDEDCVCVVDVVGDAVDVIDDVGDAVDVIVGVGDAVYGAGARPLNSEPLGGEASATPPNRHIACVSVALVGKSIA
jgi:hypothetical protein